MPCVKGEGFICMDDNEVATFTTIRRRLDTVSNDTRIICSTHSLQNLSQVSQPNFASYQGQLCMPSKKVDQRYSLLRDLTTERVDWSIQARVTRKWQSHNLKTNNELISMDFILLDENGDKVQMTLWAEKASEIDDNYMTVDSKPVILIITSTTIKMFKVVLFRLNKIRQVRQLRKETTKSLVWEGVKSSHMYTRSRNHFTIITPVTPLATQDVKHRLHRPELNDMIRQVRQLRKETTKSLVWEHFRLSSYFRRIIESILDTRRVRSRESNSLKYLKKEKIIIAGDLSALELEEKLGISKLVDRGLGTGLQTREKNFVENTETNGRHYCCVGERPRNADRIGRLLVSL
ncbi:hypothetical protein LguiB_001505 [Lonicera macranthoides]